MCHIVCCTTKIRNSSAKVQQFFEKNNIIFVFMILYDKKDTHKGCLFWFEPLAGLCRSGLFCSLTCCASRFAATNHRSSPKRHERLGDPLTVLVRDRW